jgi:hypothetical protein
MMHRVFLLLASSRLVFGQPDASSITVTATRTIYAQPDQVLFAVYVVSNADAALDSVVAALAGLGITAANLSSVSGSGRAVQDGVPGVNLGSPLQWIFTLPAPLAKLKDTIASLATLQQTISQKNAGLSMTFSVQGTQASPQPCSTPDLISDARAQAQQLANAAGVTVGPVIGISGPTPSSFPEEIVPILFIPTVFSPSYSLLGSLSATIPQVPIAPTNCSLVVQFRMLR